MKYSNFLKDCLKLNIELVQKGLVVQNFGNVSIRINNNLFCIKPSGVDLTKIKSDQLPIIDIRKSKSIIGKMKSSSDTLTHLEIYKSNPKIKSITHTHSKFATSWAQTGKNIPILGTTHADFWHREIPNINYLNKKLVENNYEKNTGLQIINFFSKKNYQLTDLPGVLIPGHGVFCWGTADKTSNQNAELIEFIAELAYYTCQIGIRKKIPKHLIDKHYFRKNGKNSYYGQK